MTRLFLIVPLLLLATQPLEAQLSSADLEDASEVARRTAGAALRGQTRLLFEVLDIDPILQTRIGAKIWSRLTERQREPLRAVVRRTFAGALAPSRSGPAEVAWASAREQAGRALVFLGVRTGGRWVKTVWNFRRGEPAGWRLEDVVLSDPGVSLADRSRRALGANPVLPRERREQARQEAWPRLAILGLIALVVLLTRHRLTPEKRTLLYLTAAAPATLFAVDGALAVRRALAEPYAVTEGLPSAPWDRWLRLAREAEREGEVDGQTRTLWDNAVAAGASPAAVAYERGLAAADRGDVATARRAFAAALEERQPAPGAARELALLALAEGRNAEAKALLDRYLAATGPDPDTLGVVAAVEANLGSPAAALEALRRAREMLGGGARGAELEARVRARMGDASGAVRALESLSPEDERPDREKLRADPAYLPIANDPAWVAYINGPPPPPRPTPAG